MKYTVLLTDMTTGTVIAEDVKRGQEVTVELQDENGNFIKVTGTVDEVLLIENVC